MIAARKKDAISSCSWPAPPHSNAFIETASAMLSDLGLDVRPGNPTRWTTAATTTDVYVIHWPDAIFWNNASHARRWFWIARILTNLTILKARGTRILWFVHNLQPHDLSPDHQRAWDVYTRGLSRLVDGWLTLSPSTGDLVRARYPRLTNKPHSYIWHPPYADSYGGNRVQAREELGLADQAIVFGHAGLLRPYKNLALLARRFEKIAPEGSQLLLTGRAKHGTGDELEELATQVRGLDYREGKLSPTEFDRALKAIDVFVAPYAQFLHSGALVHALSRGCVVVAPRAAFTEDLARALGTDWVLLYNAEPDAAVMTNAAEAALRQTGTAPALRALDPEQNLGRLRDLLIELGLELAARDKTDRGQ